MIKYPIDLGELIFFLIEDDKKENLNPKPERHLIAQSILQNYHPPTALFDAVLNRYLSYIETINGPFCTPLNELLYAESLCAHASRALVERVLSELVRFGFYNHARSTVELLERKLTEDEVMALVERYANGAVRATTQEYILIDIAEETGGQPLVDRVKKAFDEQKQRDACEVY